MIPAEPAVEVVGLVVALRETVGGAAWTGVAKLIPSTTKHINIAGSYTLYYLSVVS